MQTRIALGTWAWGAGAFGGDAVFGSRTDVENLKPVFDAAMKAGLNLWDTATVYGMGESEKILGTFVAGEKRENVEVSTKFTPQLAEMFDNSVEKMADASIEHMGCGYIDIYWIHNPMDVERWTPGLIPLLQSGRVKRVGVSNHNIKEIQRANEILGEAGFKVSAVQNHFSLLYRSSEKGGVLDYCKENGIEFWAYMVLEQGALSGHPHDAHHHHARPSALWLRLSLRSPAGAYAESGKDEGLSLKRARPRTIQRDDIVEECPLAVWAFGRKAIR